MDTVSQEDITRLLGVPHRWTTDWLIFHLARNGPVPNPIDERTINIILARQAKGFPEPLSLAHLRLKTVRLCTIDAAFAAWISLSPNKKHFPAFLLQQSIPHLNLGRPERRLISKSHLDVLFAFQSTHFSSQTLGQVVGGTLIVKQLAGVGLQRLREEGREVYRRVDVAKALEQSGLLFWCSADTWLTTALRHRQLMFLPEASALTNTPQHILRRRLDERRVPYIDQETPRFLAQHLDRLR